MSGFPTHFESSQSPRMYMPEYVQYEWSRRGEKYVKSEQNWLHSEHKVDKNTKCDSTPNGRGIIFRFRARKTENGELEDHSQILYSGEQYEVPKSHKVSVISDTRIPPPGLRSPGATEELQREGWSERAKTTLLVKTGTKDSRDVGTFELKQEGETWGFGDHFAKVINGGVSVRTLSSVSADDNVPNLFEFTTRFHTPDGTVIELKEDRVKPGRTETFANGDYIRVKEPNDESEGTDP
ncbi:uncharacterized protein I206_102922 [Kwoniella pini CBS 10737]|uniref:Uncharacterized protein n=1 Tax=Kwoniella pini CBS 10737 TaxID=1296096 RepID=A0A1B9I6N9_9TREE|nr:uncharacterized protein I206_03273 [Kwoniella pini CBS 10737]OCF51207.1 hypothetical protein I206_03273 [Kwoniella pini CBS 10737]